ncbi:hypothetical protein J121_888 [Qipengyuania citrea LAMA 915]|uniref:ATP-binding protein n=1 Tax=Qipengyuania citrea LAMA 915 TaxID=1306953 RepID=A0A0L1KGF7_9SPHN|nr:protein DpdH [Qipengyuania citrea]KNH02924.1 hypothetical protein J121_888 [Qipengyuania citrea LAMA 915]
MQNYLCWAPAQVREIINPEAEAVPDAVFRAVHSDWSLKVAPPKGTAFQEMATTSFRSLSPREFLEQFLQAERPHVQAAALGRSGSGKSHFIHWMRLNIPETPERMVLVVPKAGTSLRSIIELIVSRLDKAEQQPFRDALSRAGDATMTRDGQKGRLLNELAEAIRDLAPSDPDDELEVELIEQLPHILYDPHMRQTHFLREGTIIADVVDHVFAAPDAYRPAEDRRLFGETDLPLGGGDYAAAAQLAQNAMNVIFLPGGLAKAVDILNRSLDLAIGRTLSFSGDRLIGLMTALRRHLRRQNRELVLLIEDFARLQGIDRALLQSLLDQGNEDLCKLRWAIAVTTGFFETIAETVYTRMTWFIDMDRSSGGASGGMSRPSLAGFAARYLNAIRVGLEPIQAWGGKTTEAPVPNACERCEFRSDCHASFGSHEDVGLYPFTETALWNMAERADPRLGQEFNPRILQKDVLARVLADHGSAVAAGAFPPVELLDELGGGRRLSVLDQSAVRRQAPAAADRLLTAIELYDGSGKPVNLEEGIRRSFNLPKLGDATEPTGPEPKGPTPTPTTPTLDPRILELHAWAEGKHLSQALSQELRERIFRAVVDSIDWDNLGLERSSYAAATANRPFRNNSIKILRQSTAGLPTLVDLHVVREGASEAEVQRIALALQGMILAGDGFDWSFDGGGEMLAAFLDCLANWTAQVEAELRAFAPVSADWNAIGGAFEILAVGAALAGQLRSEWTTTDLLDACLRPWEDTAAETTELRKLFSKIVRRRQMLADFVRAHISATKGGQVGALIDPSLPRKVLRALKGANWRFVQEPPKEGRGDPFEVAKLYTEIKTELPVAAATERNARLAWLDEMETAFGPDLKRAAIIESVQSVREAVGTIGIGGSASTALQVALDAFSTRQFDDAIFGARELRNEEDPVARLPAFARAREGAVVAGRDLARRLQAFLDDAERSLAIREQEDGAKYAALAQSQLAIGTALQSISDNLAYLESANAA